MDREDWGTMPLPALMVLIQNTTIELAQQEAEVSHDWATYWSKFWTEWKAIPGDAGYSVTAMNRQCEMVCQDLRNIIAVAESIRSALAMKHKTLLAILDARSRA